MSQAEVQWLPFLSMAGIHLAPEETIHYHLQLSSIVSFPVINRNPSFFRRNQSIDLNLAMTDEPSFQMH